MQFWISFWISAFKTNKNSFLLVKIVFLQLSFKKGNCQLTHTFCCIQLSRNLTQHLPYKQAARIEQRENRYGYICKYMKTNVKTQIFGCVEVLLTYITVRLIQFICFEIFLYEQTFNSFIYLYIIFYKKKYCLSYNLCVDL